MKILHPEGKKRMMIQRDIVDGNAEYSNFVHPGFICIAMK